MSETTDTTAGTQPAAPATPPPAAPATDTALPVKGAPTPPAALAPATEAPAPTTTPTTYEPTGDAGLDVALGFVGRLGIGIDSPEMQAAIKGDFSLLKATLATRDDAKGFEHFVALGEKAFSNFAEAEAKKAQDVRAAAVSIAGSEENWSAVEDWVSANASAEEKKEILAGFNQGGVIAKALAEHLVNLHSNAVGVTTDATDAVSPDAQTTRTASGRLGKSAYRAEVAKLAQHGGTAQQFADLESRFDPRLD